MGRKIELKTSADGGQALAVLEKIIKKERKISDELRKQARVSKSTSKSVMGDFGSMGGSLLKFAAGFATVATATRLLSSELSLVEDRWAKAARTITTTGGEIFGAFSALPKQIKGLGQSFLNQVIKDAQEAGRISQREILKTFATVGSNIGEGTGQQFSQFVKTAARISGVTAQEDAPLFGGGLVKFAGLAGLGGDAEAALGLMVQLGLTTPITSLAVQAKNIPGALAKIGAEPSFIARARLFSALAQSSLDITGERSGTGAATLAASLRTAAIVRDPITGKMAPLPEEVVKGRSTIQIAESLRDILEAETGPGLETERGRRLRREEVIATVGGEKTTKAFLSGILTRDPFVESKIRFARQELQPIETEAQRAALRRLGDEQIRQAERDPLVRQLRTQRAFESAVETLQLGDLAGGQRGIFLKGIKGIIEATPGESALRSSLEGIRAVVFDAAGGDAVQSGINTLRGIVERNRPRRAFVPTRIPGIFGGDRNFGIGPRLEATTGPFVDPGNKAVVDAINGLISMLAEDREFAREQLEAQKANTEELKKNGNGAGGRFRPADNNDFE